MNNKKPFKYVFHKPPTDFAPRMEVAAAFCEYRDKILFLKRNPKTETQGNRWCPPGGGMEKHETPHQAILRELFEETGITINQEQAMLVHKVFKRNPEHDLIVHFFKIQFNELPNIQLNDEHQEFAWVTLQEALTMPLIHGEEEVLQLMYPDKFVL